LIGSRFLGWLFQKQQLLFDAFSGATNYLARFDDNYDGRLSLLITS
jgi:hypothetical protein